MNKTGISLPPDYLIEQKTPMALSFESLLGPPAEALPKLREAGADSIELRTIRPGADPEVVRAAIQRAAEAGFQLTLHGLLHPEESDPADPVGFPLWNVAEEVRRLQGAAVVTVHARFRDGRGGPLDALLKQTVRDLKALAAETRRRNAPFTYALEINKLKERTDPSFRWEGVIEMAEAIGDPIVGICWDFGHAYYNHLAGLIGRIPPEPFLRRVIHTHIHDLGPGNCTHWPLSEGRVPVREFCGKLTETGYDGVLNLELEPPRFTGTIHGPEGGERILESARLLSEIAQTATQAPQAPEASCASQS